MLKNYIDRHGENMEQLKPYVVYWIGQTQLKKAGWYTPTFNAKCMTFDSMEAADKTKNKLKQCEAEGKPFQQRLVSNIASNY